MATKLRVLVLVCSTRPNALGPSIGRWLTDTLTRSAGLLDADLELRAIGDLDLPFLDEEEHPSTALPQHDHTRRWSRIVNKADGFVFVTPEYNHGMPATLKNALDYLGPEWAWKPVGFVSYGHTSSGTRAVQHAKQVVTALRLVPLGATVALKVADAFQDSCPTRDARHAAAAQDLLAELVRVARALTPMREREFAASSPGPVTGSYTRRLGPDDAAEVTVLQRCCWMDEAIDNNTLSIPALHESPAEVRDWLGTWHATGLWRDGRLLGMVRTRKSGTDLHVGRLGVAPDLRGAGTGRWLLRQAEAAGADCERIVLSTGAASHRNLSLYRRQGYVPLPDADDGAVVRLAKSTEGAG
ncbi:GNAT family N-acetyltransferase [Streptomyces sp. NPDC051684]|uniref:GNAT family N-acetyltransferase n=1 Tax=Streptomyces sp. NPDC051684 TaxID=3365670 RepID=UPI0037B340FD